MSIILWRWFVRSPAFCFFCYLCRTFSCLIFLCFLKLSRKKEGERKRNDAERRNCSFNPNLLLNEYVCAFLVVRRIAQWRDRYRIHEANECTKYVESEEAMVRECWKAEWKKAEREREEKVGKLKTFLLTISFYSCCRMDFPSSLIFSLGFGFHDSSCVCRWACKYYSPVQKCES